jgi:hypothetical protein
MSICHVTGVTAKKHHPWRESRALSSSQNNSHITCAQSCVPPAGYTYAKQLACFMCDVWIFCYTHVSVEHCTLFKWHNKNNWSVKSRLNEMLYRGTHTLQSYSFLAVGGCEVRASLMIVDLVSCVWYGSDFPQSFWINHEFSFK